MYIFSDLQIHSKFSRAVSKDMTLPNIAAWAKKKGIQLVATGDWTHPLWMKDIQRELEEIGNGFMKLGEDLHSPLFLLATEVSCIYSQNGKGRRIHTLIWVPTIASAVKINQQMTKQGCNLLSDGRPIIGLTSMQVAELVFSIEPNALIIPAHAWTPWFALFGSMSGFDSLAEAFGPYANNIFAVETGLSSNPGMNWQISELDNRAIVSFSDAHSGAKMGREATVFEFDGLLKDFRYTDLYNAIRYPTSKPTSLTSKIAFTIEFFPEEGKYHVSGHRSCGIRWGPEETRSNGTTCPVCGKQLTQGVLQRVEQLAGRKESELGFTTFKAQLFESGAEIIMTKSQTFPYRPPYCMMVPLLEIIAECLDVSPSSKRAVALYEQMIQKLGPEFVILLQKTNAEIQKVAGERVAEGIRKVRDRDIYIDPGYDGVFGVVKLWNNGEKKPLIDSKNEQLTLGI